MKQKKGFRYFKSIMNLVLVVPHIISLISNIMSLISKEARLAGKSLVMIIVLSLLFFMLLTVSWLCLFGLLFLHLISMQFSPEASLGIILLTHFVLLLIIGITISKVKNNLLFIRTRRQCAALCKVVDED